MKSTRRALKSATAFTIVELIAVIAVIAILVGLLVPALSMVQKMAANVSQKAQFATISLGLETYREDMGDYPDSNASGAMGSGYYGAQKLAEAMIGQDGFGYHPDSDFRSDGFDVTGSFPLYKPDIDTWTPAFTSAEIAANLASRKGPYLELDTANAVKLDSIYSTTDLSASGLSGSTFVLADKFKKVKNTATGKKIGMPILYFRANTLLTKHSFFSLSLFKPTNENTYNYLDNRGYVDLPAPFDGSTHDMEMDMSIFYTDTVNPNFTNPKRPHNNESFILLSAGADGMYGTGDDVYNFEKNE